MKLLERDIGSIDYAANQQRTLQLPRNYAYRILSLKLTCTLTWTETTAGVVKDSAPAQLISNIVLRANGRDVIKNYDLETLHRLCQIRYGTRPKIISPASTGALAAQALEVHAYISLEMWRAVKPIDTLLDSSGLATLDLIVTWATGAAIFGGAYGGTVTVTAATLYVSSIEAVGVPAGTRFMVNKEFSIQSVITAASTQHQINLPTSNLYRCFVLKTVSDDCHVNTILNNIQIKSGTEVYKNGNALHFQMRNRLDYMLECPVSTAAALGGADYINNLLTGYYMLEFVRDGRLTECLDTSRLSSLELILDVNNPGTTDILSIYPVELIVPPVQNA